MNNTKLLLIFLVIILLGFFYNQIWISFIIGAVLLLTMFVQPEPPTPKPLTGPIIRPIKVQRKYVGDASIYPEEMEIKIHGKPIGREEFGPEGVGKAIGSSLRWVKNLFESD